MFQLRLQKAIAAVTAKAPKMILAAYGSITCWRRTKTKDAERLCATHQPSLKKSLLKLNKNTELKPPPKTFYHHKIDLLQGHGLPSSSEDVPTTSSKSTNLSTFRAPGDQAWKNEVRHETWWMRHDLTVNPMWYFSLPKAVPKSTSCSLWSTCNICLKSGRVSSHGSDRDQNLLSARSFEPSASEPLLKQALNLWNAFEMHANSVKITARAVETVLLQFQWNVCVCVCVNVWAM